MAANSEKSGHYDVITERTRLESVFRSYDQERILHLLKTSRLSREGSMPDLIDRLVRFDLRRTFGAEAASWDIASDNDPTRATLMPSLEFDESFDDVTTRTDVGEVTNEQNPALNYTVRENSEQPAY